MSAAPMIGPQAASASAWAQCVDATNQRDGLLDDLFELLEGDPKNADALALVGRIQERAGAADEFAYAAVMAMERHLTHLAERGASASRKARP